MISDKEQVKYSLVIIGAGPHALSLILRLASALPSSLYNDNEHQRMISKCSKHKRHSWKPLKGVVGGYEVNGKKILIIDEYGAWNARWQFQFDAYKIQNLRSPAFFHPDPSDTEALRAFAESEERLDELKYVDELFGKCIKCSAPGDKKKSQHRSLFNERDRLSFCIPSTALFNDFCAHLRERFDISNEVYKAIVSSIVPRSKNGFNVHTSDGAMIMTEKVVVSIGHFNIPRIPEWAKGYISKDVESPGKIIHAKEMLATFNEDVILTEEQKNLPILIVGGGLTSAHLAILASKRGYREVVLTSRKRLVVKHFDASLDWVGRYKQVQFSKFYSSANEERLKMIRMARNGGSITPEAYGCLLKLVENGLLAIRDECEVQDVKLDDGIFSVSMKRKDEVSVSKFGEIWLATGSCMDVNQEPIFKEMMKQCPVESVGGFPAVTEELQWSRECPNFYVMGGYAALQLGPNAINLNGARAGAERVGSEILEDWENDSCGCQDDVVSAVFGNAGNYFSILEAL